MNFPTNNDLFLGLAMLAILNIIGTIFIAHWLDGIEKKIRWIADALEIRDKALDKRREI